MGVLKVLALVLLSFLLFLSLSVFGLALTLNYTVLNPDFLVSEVDKLDIPSLTEEFLSEEMTEEEFPEEFRAALIDTITELEPQIKEQVSAVIYPIYDYLLGKSQSLDLAATLSDTVLNPDFIVSIVDELDISSLAEEFVSGQVIEEIPEELEYLTEYVDDVVIELEPWVKEQARIAIPSIVDYLLGQSQSLNVVISLEPVMESLEDTLREAFLASPPPELAHLPPAQLAQYFDEYFGELVEMVPSTFELDESLLSTEIPAQIAEALAEAEEALAQARQYVGYFKTGYYALIGFILLLILGIVLLNRQVKGATRILGIEFLTYGVIWYAGTFIVKHIGGTQVTQLDLPAQLQALLPQVLNDFLAPLVMFSLGLLIAGIALMVVSFIYKSRQPSVEEPTA